MKVHEKLLHGKKITGYLFRKCTRKLIIKAL